MLAVGCVWLSAFGMAGCALASMTCFAVIVLVRCIDFKQTAQRIEQAATVHARYDYHIHPAGFSLPARTARSFPRTRQRDEADASQARTVLSRDAE